MIFIFYLPFSNLSRILLFDIAKQAGMIKGELFRYKLVFSVLGAIDGFLYWKFVGCTSGTCLIKSVWNLSTLWGTAVGYLLGDLSGSFFLKRKAKNE
jgi:hypothetical protein